MENDQQAIANKKARNIKIGAKVALILVMINVVGQLVATYQTAAQVISPLIPESIVWEINKQFVLQALISAVAAIAGLILYFYEKYLYVIILIAVVLIASRYVYLPAGI